MVLSKYEVKNMKLKTIILITSILAVFYAMPMYYNIYGRNGILLVNAIGLLWNLMFITNEDEI